MSRLKTLIMATMAGSMLALGTLLLAGVGAVSADAGGCPNLAANAPSAEGNLHANKVGVFDAVILANPHDAIVAGALGTPPHASALRTPKETSRGC